MIEIVNQVLPILILLAVGAGMRRVRFITSTTVDGLRTLVVNLTLPAVLFIAFVEVDFDPKDAVVVGVTFFLGVFLLGLGRLLQPRFGGGREYFPFLLTGFEAGMLGISLFGSAYGLSQIGLFAVVDLGHELFIWFVFLAFLLAKRDGATGPRRLVSSFFRSPVILGILSGIALNLIGWGESVREWPISGGIMGALEFLASLTVPLILLIVGYGIRLDPRGIREAAGPVVLRLLLVLPLALVLPGWLMGDLLGADELSQAALFTLLILPPPFIIPLYMRVGIEDEQRYVNNVLSLYTLVSIGVFVAYLALNPV